MSEEAEISPEMIALSERWKDASHQELLDAYDNGEDLDGKSHEIAYKLFLKREAAAEGDVRYPLGSHYKRKAGSDIDFHDISYIQISPDRRPLNEDRVAELMESIRKVGLLHPPIVVYRDGFMIDGEEEDRVPVLVAGRHRIEAWRRLGHSRVPCLALENVSDVEAELIEISENLHRAELTALQRGEQIARWIELTSAAREAVLRQPDAKPGRPEGGVRAAARELGLSGADARRAMSVASLSQEAKQAAVDADLDDNRSVLLAAAKEKDPAKQVEVIQARSRGEKVSQQPVVFAFRAERQEADDLSSELALMLAEYLPEDMLLRARVILENHGVVDVRYESGIPVVPILRDIDALINAKTASTDNIDGAPIPRTPEVDLEAA